MNKHVAGFPCASLYANGSDWRRADAARPSQPYAVFARLPRPAGRARPACSEAPPGWNRDHGSQFGRGNPRGRSRGRSGFPRPPRHRDSTDAGHVLAYGVREVIPRNLSVADTVERIVALGGVPVAAHPYRFWSGLGEAPLADASFPAYETCNARTLRRGNVRARALARKRKLGETGGSDSHFLDEVARAVTAVDA